MNTTIEGELFEQALAEAVRVLDTPPAELRRLALDIAALGEPTPVEALARITYARLSGDPPENTPPSPPS